MTDGRLYQLAAVGAVLGEPEARVQQLAAVAVCSEVPPVAGGARIYQYAVQTVSVEFVIPQVYVPSGVGGFIQTMPYYIMPFPGE